MAYQFTLADARGWDELIQVCGVDRNSQAFVDLLNTVQRRLMKRGDFFGMVQTMCLVFQGCVVAWPREVGTVIGVRRGNGRGFQIQNQWYSFTGGWRQHHSCWHSDCVFEDLNPAPIYNDIFNTPNGMLIRYYVVNQADYGKGITLFGSQAGGQPLQELDGATGKTVNGVTLTATSPFISTSGFVTDISSITRDATVGMAYLYQYNPSTGDLIDLAVFQPNDTNPMFRRSKIQNFGMRFCCGSGNDPTVPKFNSIEALVKLKFIPVQDERDFLLVDDRDALEFGMQAIKAERANDIQTSEAKFIEAIRELNFNDRDKNPDDQTPVTVQAISSRHVIHNPN